MTDEILYPLREGTPEQRLQPLMERYWSELGRWRFEVNDYRQDLGYFWDEIIWHETTRLADVDKVRLVRIPRTIKVEIPEPWGAQYVPQNIVQARFDTREQAQQFLDAIKEAKGDE